MVWRSWRSILREERRQRLAAEVRAARAEKRLEQAQDDYFYRLDVMTNAVLNARGPSNTFIKGVKPPEDDKPKQVEIIQMTPSQEAEYDATIEAYLEEHSFADAERLTRANMGLANNVRRYVA